MPRRGDSEDNPARGKGILLHSLGGHHGNRGGGDETHAAPMLGGVVTSLILELTVYLAIFAAWKGRGLLRQP